MARRGKPVIIVIQGDDKASNVMEKVQLGLRDFESRAKRTDLSVAKLRHSWIAATAAVGAMAAALFKLAAVTAEQERVEKRLEAVYRTTGGTVGLSTTALEDYATALGRATVVGDEAILKIESILLTFRKVSGDTFKGATELIFDMAEVMETDAKSAALQLGKALNDPIKGISALTRVGVSFTEAQKAQIKQLTESNDVMGAQQIILGELRSEFGGAAKAAGQTFGGQVAILKNNFVDLAQEIGKMNDGPLSVAVHKWNDWAVAAVNALARVNKEAAGQGGSITDLTKWRIKQAETELETLNKQEALLQQVYEAGGLGAQAALSDLESTRAKQMKLISDISTFKKVLSSGINLGEKKTTPGPVAPDTGGEDVSKGQTNALGAYLAQVKAESNALIETQAATMGRRNELETADRENRINILAENYQHEQEMFMAHNQALIDLDNQRRATKQRNAEMEVEASRMGLQALATLFPKVKAFAIGESLINTYQAITNALKSVPYPYNFVAAGLTAAQGFAQVKAIQSQGISAGGGGTSSYTYGGASATVPQAAAQPATNVTINVSGGTRVMTPEEQAQIAIDSLESHLKETGNKIGSIELNVITGG